MPEPPRSGTCGSRATPRRSRWAPSRWRSAIAAEAARRGVDVAIVRNGTRGMCWLEPLVEVETAGRARRLRPGDAGGRAGAVRRRLSRRRLARAARRPDRGHPVLREAGAAHLRARRPHRSRQPRRVPGARRLPRPAARADDGARRDRAGSDRLRSARARRRGVSRPASSGRRCSTRRPTRSTSPATPTRAIPGTFADRMLMEGDPFVLIEGMTIAALAVGATQGYIYLRVEYPHAHRALREAIAAAYAARISRAERPRQRQGVRPRGAARRRRLHLRRRDVDAREPRGQARRGPPPAAAAGGQGPLRPADDRQQRHLARQRPDHSRTRARAFYRDYGIGQVARHAADPARRATSSAAG